MSGGPKPDMSDVEEDALIEDGSLQAPEETAPRVIAPLSDDFAETNVVLLHPLVVPRRRVQRAVKRGIDIAAGLVLILLVLPIVPLIGLAIVLDSRGPTLFLQPRVGRRGAEFRLFKFRTMVAEGQDALGEHVASNGSLLQEWERSRKLRNDPRVTRVGSFLRRHSIDELPQIINVLRGDMSLVGPRPVREDEISYFGERAAQVLNIRPGLTGLWAVSGRSDLSYEERADLEHRYAVEWNLWLDLKILLRTIPVVVRGHGAY